MLIEMVRARNILGAAPGIFAHLKCLESTEYFLLAFPGNSRIKEWPREPEIIQVKSSSLFCTKVKALKVWKIFCRLFQEFLENQEGLDTPSSLGFFLNFLHVQKRPEKQEFYPRIPQNSWLL